VAEWLLDMRMNILALSKNKMSLITEPVDSRL